MKAMENEMKVAQEQISARLEEQERSQLVYKRLVMHCHSATNCLYLCLFCSSLFCTSCSNNNNNNNS